MRKKKKRHSCQNTKHYLFKYMDKIIPSKRTWHYSLEEVKKPRAVSGWGKIYTDISILSGLFLVHS